MNSCKIIKIQTPKNFLLNGLWFGSEKANTVCIYIHGLGGSVFSQTGFIDTLVDKNTAVFAFNNRGSGIVSRIAKINKKLEKGYESHIVGQAHEVFSDCVDDIDGAVKFAEKTGVKNIFLIGHSTGCQKSIYYLSKRKNPKIKGVVLLAPMSDYADFFTFTDVKKRKAVTSFAKKMVESGKSHDLIPKKVWQYTIDAQRFLSLFTPDSTEEIFSYAVLDKNPKILKSVKVPMQIIFAGNDEYKDRPIAEIVEWFKRVLSKTVEINVVKDSPHNFKGYENSLITLINNWRVGVL